MSEELECIIRLAEAISAEVCLMGHARNRGDRDSFANGVERIEGKIELMQKLVKKVKADTVVKSRFYPERDEGLRLV